MHVVYKMYNTVQKIREVSKIDHIKQRSSKRMEKGNNDTTSVKEISRGCNSSVDQRHLNDVAAVTQNYCSGSLLSLSCNIVKKRKTMYRRAGEILVQYAMEAML